MENAINSADLFLKLGRQDDPVLTRPAGLDDKHLSTIEKHIGEAHVTWPNLKRDGRSWDDAMHRARRLFGDFKVGDPRQLHVLVTCLCIICVCSVGVCLSVSFCLSGCVVLKFYLPVCWNVILKENLPAVYELPYKPHNLINRKLS